MLQPKNVNKKDIKSGQTDHSKVNILGENYQCFYIVARIWSELLPDVVKAIKIRLEYIEIPQIEISTIYAT